MIAFNTANLVARVTGYRFTLSRWGEQAAQTTAQTDDTAWAAICAEIAAAGYTAVEIWSAHADPSVLDEKGARRRLTILHDHGLTPVGYAGTLTEETAHVCQWLGISRVNGGFWGTDLATVQGICDRYDLFANFENHPESSAAEIVVKVGGGSERIGVCIDSGWLGTQDVDAADAVRTLGPLVRHVHVKDVAAVGSHHTCPLGTGIVDLVGLFAALKDGGYCGWYSWEDEPEDRNPMEIAAASRAWIARHLAA
jgi:sugar phosphate isomerase/epimerase